MDVSGQKSGKGREGRREEERRKRWRRRERRAEREGGREGRREEWMAGERERIFSHPLHFCSIQTVCGLGDALPV